MLLRIEGSASDGASGTPVGGSSCELSRWENSYAVIGAHYHHPIIGYAGGQELSGGSNALAEPFVAINHDRPVGAGYRWVAALSHADF